MTRLTQAQLTSIALIAYGLAFDQNKKKQSMQIADNYLKKQIEVGDIVHMVKNKTISKFREREGTVIQVIGNRSKVLWDKRTTIEYEFNDNLKIVRMAKDTKNSEEKYYVMLIGKNQAFGIYDTYEMAELEAKSLVNRQQLPAYVLKPVSYIEIATPKVTKL